MITKPPKPPESEDDSEDFWPNDEQKQDLLKLCEQITGESPTPSHLHRRRPNRGHSNGLRGFLTIAATIAITLPMGWFSSFYFFGVAEQAKKLQIQAQAYREQLREDDIRHIENVAKLIEDKEYNDTFIYLKALIDARPEERTVDAVIKRREAAISFLQDLWGEDVDLSHIEEQLTEIDNLK